MANYRCDTCRAYRKRKGRYPTQQHECADCNRRAVYVQAWKRTMRQQGKEAVEEHRARLLEQLDLLDIVLEVE